MAKINVIILCAILLYSPLCTGLVDAEVENDDEKILSHKEVVDGVFGLTPSEAKKVAGKITAQLKQWEQWQIGCKFGIAWSLMAQGVMEIQAAAATSSSTLEKEKNKEPISKVHNHGNRLISRLMAAITEESNHPGPSHLVSRKHADSSQWDAIELLQVQEKKRKVAFDGHNIKPYISYYANYLGHILYLLTEETLGVQWISIMGNYYLKADEITSRNVLVYYLKKMSVKWGIMWRGIALIGDTQAVSQLNGITIQSKASGLGASIAHTRWMAQTYALSANLLTYPSVVESIQKNPTPSSFAGFMNAYAGIMGNYCSLGHIIATAPPGVIPWDVPAKWKNAAPYWKYSLGYWLQTGASWITYKNFLATQPVVAPAPAPAPMAAKRQ